MSGNNFSVTVNLDSARQRLGALQELAKPAIRDAVNKTADKARRRLDNKIRETYVVKIPGLNKKMEIKKATNKILTAHITADGYKIPLYKFKMRSNEAGTGGRAALAMKKKNSRLGELIHPKTNAKAFVATVRAFAGRDDKGNVKYSENKKITGIFQRPGKKGKRSIRLLYGDSIPEMIENIDVYGVVEPYIKEDLENELDNQIKRRLEK